MANNTTVTQTTTNLSVSVTSVQDNSYYSNDTTISLTIDPLISKGMLHIITMVNIVVIGQIVAIFGIITNVINIIVYLKIGFKESINISLCGLALSDALSCVFLVWYNLCMTPSFQELDLPFVPGEVFYITAGMPHVLFTKITGCITAFITFERCLCVLLPLRVKTIMTPTRVKIVIVSIYIVMVAAFSPSYYISSLDWKFYPSLNKSLVGLVFVENRYELEKIMFPILGIIVPFVFFTINAICTGVLVARLKKKSKWRNENSSATSDSTQASSSRDTKAATMVVMISVVFIVCFLPNLMASLLMVAIPQLAVGGPYQNTVEAYHSVQYILESVNACVNTAIYYTRSSVYKTTFDAIFFRKPAG